jgi:hypothetical protein
MPHSRHEPTAGAPVVIEHTISFSRSNYVQQIPPALDSKVIQS